MIFQKNIKNEEVTEIEVPAVESDSNDDVETVVGPSVNVEGDLSSNGNIIIKGSVMGSVNTSKMLTAEKGSKIVANVKAGNAIVSGEIKGNIKVVESLELTASSRVLGDITAKTLSVEPGAVIYGKITMPGVDAAERKSLTNTKKKKSALMDIRK